jgi:hypothetical protein
MSDKPAREDDLLTPQQCCDAELYAFYVKLALKYGDDVARRSVADLLRTLLSH